MKNVVNIAESILLSITIVVVMAFFTLGNARFLYHEFDKYDYYQDVYNDITNEFRINNIDYHIKVKDVKEDINKYVKHSFNIKITNRVKEDKNNIYLSKITFDKKFDDIDMDLIKNVTFMVALGLIIITGVVFTKTKKIHNIRLILIISSILLAMVYGGVKLFINIPIIIFNNCVIDVSYYLLFISCFILSFSVAKLIKNKLK